MKQQTAIEWLVDQLKEFAFIPEHHIGMGDIRVSQGYLDELAEQAKQMEKEQIVDAHGNRYVYKDEIGIVIDSVITGEQYYNETYNTSHNK